jgi:hypothetical protein
MLKVIGSVRNAYVPYFVHISWHDQTLIDGGTLIRTWISDKLSLCTDIEIEKFWSREIYGTAMSNELEHCDTSLPKTVLQGPWNAENEIPAHERRWY